MGPIEVTLIKLRRPSVCACIANHLPSRSALPTLLTCTDNPTICLLVGELKGKKDASSCWSGSAGIALWLYLCLMKMHFIGVPWP